MNIRTAGLLVTLSFVHHKTRSRLEGYAKHGREAAESLSCLRGVARRVAFVSSARLGPFMYAYIYACVRVYTRKYVYTVTAGARGRG